MQLAEAKVRTQFLVSGAASGASTRVSLRRSRVEALVPVDVVVVVRSRRLDQVDVGVVLAEQVLELQLCKGPLHMHASSSS